MKWGKTFNSYTVIIRNRMTFIMIGMLIITIIMPIPFWDGRLPTVSNVESVRKPFLSTYLFGNCWKKWRRSLKQIKESTERQNREIRS